MQPVLIAPTRGPAGLDQRSNDHALLDEGRVALIAASDCFVLYDNVQFIKNGWIERNRYLLEGEPKWFGLPLAKGSHSQLINQRQISPHFDIDAIMSRLAFAYRKAPHAERTLTWLEALLKLPAHNIAEFNELALRSCCSLLRIHTPIVRASEWALVSHARGQDRVLETIRAIGGTRYLNPFAGGALYDSAAFAAAGYGLDLLKPDLEPYLQLNQPFVPALSVLDAFMFNDLETLSAWVKRGEIVRG
jgi:hypothetical protein